MPGKRWSQLVRAHFYPVENAFCIWSAWSTKTSVLSPMEGAIASPVSAGNVKWTGQRCQPNKTNLAISIARCPPFELLCIFQQPKAPYCSECLCMWSGDKGTVVFQLHGSLKYGLTSHLYKAESSIYPKPTL